MTPHFSFKSGEYIMAVKWNHKVLIYFDDEHTPEETVAEVSRLISEGYTSGIDPNWEITEEEDTEDIFLPTLKREDFTYECSIGGYMLWYKGQQIGGAGMIVSSRKKDSLFAVNRIKNHMKRAEQDIQDIINGNPKNYEDAIKQVEGV